MRTHPFFVAAALLLLAGCRSSGAAAPAATAPETASGVRQFRGTVQAVDTGCYVDGVCTATVDGIVVTTMSGERLNNPVWGQPNALPQVGQQVEVRCRSTGASRCTLKGDTGYYLRPLR